MTGRAPRCSVVIPTYNRMELLARTLDGLVRQDLPARSFEVLVCDDGSADATAALVDCYAGDLDIRHLRQPDEGFRPAAARNLGIEASRAGVCVFLDSGVLPHSAFLRSHLDTHARHDRAAVVGYVYCFEHGDEEAARMRAAIDLGDIDGTIERFRADGRWPDVRENFYGRYAEADPLPARPAPWLVFWTCNVSVRTDQLRSVGGFDEAFRSWGGEDADLAYRLFHADNRFTLNRDAVAIHYPHPKSHTGNAEGQLPNLRYIVDKYRTPAVALMLADPPIDFFAINDHIDAHGVPDCVPQGSIS